MQFTNYLFSVPSTRRQRKNGPETGSCSPSPETPICSDLCIECDWCAASLVAMPLCLYICQGSRGCFGCCKTRGLGISITGPTILTPP